MAAEGPDLPLAEPDPAPRLSERARLLIALALPLCAFAVQWAFWSFLHPFSWFLFYPTVFIAAWSAGLRGGLAASVLSTGLVWHFFPPEGVLHKYDARFILSAAVFLATGVLFSVFQERLRGAQRALALAYQQTRKSEAVLDTIVSISADAIITTDEAHRVLLFNDGAARIFGWSADEVLGRHIEMLIPQPVRAMHRERVAAFVGGVEQERRMQGDRPSVRGLRKSGEEFELEASIAKMKVHGKDMFTVTLRDVTERRRVEREAEIASRRLANAIEGIQDAVALFDEEDRLVLCNSEFRQMFFSDHGGPVVGQTFEALLDERLAHGVLDLGGLSREELRRRRMAYRKHPQGSLDIRTTDGRSLRVRDRRTEDGGVVTTLWDLTDDVRREDELRRARALAEAASAAKSEFLASMSHELRTPLNAVLGFARLLQRDRKEPLSDRHRGMVDHVVKGGEHLLHLIDEVLDLARIEAGGVSLSPEPVGVAALLRSVAATLGPMASGAGVEVEIQPPPSDLPPLLGDRVRCAQVLINYGSNAIKYGRRGTRVSFSAALVEGRVRLHVVDDGAGIPVEQQAKLFQPFQRAGQEGGAVEGTGIGLAISKRLAEMMKGSVGFTSVPGQGSDFWIELPAAPAPMPSEGARAAALAAAHGLADAEGPRVTVVYVEDNPSSVALMEALLSGFARIELLTAPSAEIGIELIHARRPALVLMDINLPGMSGFEAVARLRASEETRDIPVIALSAAAMSGDGERAVRAGFSRYLTKPVEIDALIQEVERILATPLAPR